MTSEQREHLRAPSEWDVLIFPDLAPLFVLEAAIVAAHAALGCQLEPASSMPGGANHPPIRHLLRAMRILRAHIRNHRIAHEAREPSLAEVPDSDDAFALADVAEIPLK